VDTLTIPSATTHLKPFFRFPFQDPEARTRFMIGCALLLGGFVVPVVPGLVVYGYALRILRRSAEGEAPAMPPWDAWGEYLGLGARAAVVWLAFTLPALAAFALGMGAYFGTFLLLLPVSASADSAGGDAFFALTFLSMAVLFLSMAIGTILLAIGVVPLPAALSHLAVKDRLGAAFSPREWWPILWANRLGYFIAFVIVMGIFGLSYLVFYALYATLVLLCVGFLLMIPIGLYAMLVGAAFFGDAYREGART
jgi:hypothetical protein